jgi:hypothetical protein
MSCPEIIPNNDVSCSSVKTTELEVIHEFLNFKISDPYYKLKGSNVCYDKHLHVVGTLTKICGVYSLKLK